MRAGGTESEGASSSGPGWSPARDASATDYAALHRRYELAAVPEPAEPDWNPAPEKFEADIQALMALLPYDLNGNLDHLVIEEAWKRMSGSASESESKPKLSFILSDDEEVRREADKFIITEKGRQLGRAEMQGDQFPEEMFQIGEEFEAETDEEPFWLLEGHFNVGVSLEDGDHATIIGMPGSSGSGKSTLAGDLLRCACDGESWGGSSGSLVNIPEGHTVAYANLEMSKALFRGVFIKPLSIRRKDKYVSLTITSPVPVTTPKGQEWWAHRLQDAKVFLWIVDSHAVLSQSENENDSSETTRFFSGLRLVAARAGVRAVLLVDHTGHTATDRSRGSSAKKDRADEVFAYELADKDSPDGLRILVHTKSRWGWQGRSVGVEWDRETRRHTFEPESKADIRLRAKAEDAERTIAAKEEELSTRAERMVEEISRRVVDGEEPITNQRQAQKVLGCKTSHVPDIRQHMVDQGLIKPGLNGAWELPEAPQ